MLKYTFLLTSVQTNAGTGYLINYEFAITNVKVSLTTYMSLYI